MWRERIVAAALLRDNGIGDAAVRERLADARPLWLAVRVVTLANLLSMVLGVRFGSASPLHWQIAIAVWVLHEVNVARARRSLTVEMLAKRRALGSFGFALWAAAAFQVYEGWMGVVPFLIVIGASSLVLDGRPLALLTGACVALMAGQVVAEHFGYDPVPETSVMASWWSVLAGAVSFCGTAGMGYSATRRLRNARAQTQHVLEELRETERKLFESHEQLRRWNADLHRTVDQKTTELAAHNRQLAIVNRVWRALSDAAGQPDVVSPALRLLSDSLKACVASVYYIGDGSRPPLQSSVAAHGGDGALIPRSVMHEVATTGEAQLWSGGVETEHHLAVTPMFSAGRPVGALAVSGDAEGGWSTVDQRILGMIAREVLGALERQEVFEAAVLRAERESVLSEVMELLDSTADANALELALRAVAGTLGAQHAALVVRLDGARLPVVTVRNWKAGDGRLQAIERALPAMPGLVTDRVHPLALGEGGEAPLSEAMRGLGVRSMLVVPVSQHRRRTGAIVLTRAAAVWDDEVRELLERVALAFGARLEADELTRLQARRIEELSRLAQIGEIVQSTVDPERLFGGFTRALAGLMPFEVLHFARLNADGELASVVTYDADGRGTPQPVRDAAEGSHAWFSLRAAVLWSEAASKAPTFYSHADRPTVLVPLRPKGHVLGVLGVTPVASPSSDQIALVSQAVAQLALALDSASLYRQATERAARIQVLGNLARIVASVVDLRFAFDAFAEEVRWLIPFDRAVMLWVDEAAKTVEPYAVCPQPETPLPPRTPLTVSPAYLAYATQHAASVRRDDPAYALSDWDVFGDDVCEVAMVPVLRGDRCTAVFALAHSGDEPYSADEIAALEEVARLLAVSIERVELFQQAEHSARHDMLTGLPNARYLQERLAEVTTGITAPGSTAVLMVDMDDLKLFNDTLGHQVGDDVIALVGSTMRAVVRPQDFVARVGGDEFVAVMEDVSPEEAYGIADGLQAALREAHLGIHGAPTSVRVSAGVAVAPGDADSVQDLMQAADIAMYEAKFAGGGRTAIADGLTSERMTRALRGRPDRLVETVVRAATAAASLPEREAVGVAQRYAVATALRMGVPAHESEVLRMLVARHAGMRVVDTQPGLDQSLAFTVLDGLSREWATHAPESAALGQVVVTTAVELAWLQLAEPYGAGLGLSDALGRLSELRRRSLETAVLQEMAQAARGETGEPVERRRAA